MAHIALAPGEEFEHYHMGVSTTTLLEGDVRLAFDGSLVDLRIGETVIIPGNTPHVMLNTGSARAIVECGHMNG